MSPARRLERSRDWRQPRPPLRRPGEVVVVDGFGVSVRVERGRLVVRGGAGRSRRERAFSRASSQLARLVVLGGSGALSLEAIRWLGSVGAGLICIDRDGDLLCTSGPTRSEARLRRAQALASSNDSGLAIARYLLGAKLAGQRRILDDLPRGRGDAARVLDRSIKALELASNIEDATAAEAEAAAAYWRQWAAVEVRFQPGDRRRLPEHWRRFGQRSSPLSGSPRVAVTPAGAILNYLYSLLETEARLACLTLGLDPAQAIVHADIRGRDSLPLDLMEAVRPSVDRYLHHFLQERVLRVSDFYETGRGNCRLLAPLTHELAETLPAWRELLAPVAEQVVSLLLGRESTTLPLPTPLTGHNRRADRARRQKRQFEPSPLPTPQPVRRCRRCGGELPHPRRTYCGVCRPEPRSQRINPSPNGAAEPDRRETMADRRREVREWNAAHSELTDPDLFGREILPAIQELPLADLVRATGLSRGYLSQVRNGYKQPHPRHWPALRQAAKAS